MTSASFSKIFLVFVPKEITRILSVTSCGWFIAAQRENLSKGISKTIASIDKEIALSSFADSFALMFLPLRISLIELV
jgi:hypothetical protein